MDSFITPMRTSDFVLAPSTFGLVWRKRYNRDSSEEEEDSLTQPLMDTLQPNPETLVTHSSERDGLSLSTPLEVECDCGLGESPADKVNGKDGAQTISMEELNPKGLALQTELTFARNMEEHHFATFYAKSSQIPVWSAYTIDEGNCTDTASETWKVEPQMANLAQANMEMEGKLLQDLKQKNQKENQSIKEKLKEKQAINEDYERTHYDRGHLNPNSFQCGQGRIATFTLTNAVPMDPCFNRKDDKQRNINRDAERVVVPSHIWTAVCCEHSDNNKKFSFGFLGMNRPDSILEPMKVTRLNKELTGLYGNLSGRPIKIFNDDCNEDSTKAQHVLLEITKQLRDTFPNWGNHLSGNKRPQNNPPAIDSSKKKPKP
ncbi:Endonuclease domain-containing 1 protein [Platysternon megacephalum]|uniref:Endonuclease domain-containing 1 protein n=1 Tax=Platysternon megacephalum TaxID=55544 RepID=A0A4D9DGE7_9SAUR|nr:Endonuclease domain-containing 1 protein [Platysternon megacephalum]